MFSCRKQGIKMKTIAKWGIKHPVRVISLLSIAGMILLYIVLTNLYMHWLTGVFVIGVLGAIGWFILYLVLDRRQWKLIKDLLQEKTNRD